MNKPNPDNIKKYIPEELLKSNKVSLVGVRGYFLDSMGEKGKNDRGVYDDAIAVVSPKGIMTFNANNDPAVFKKGIANLIKGNWTYKLGIHGLNKPKLLQYEAFVQAAPVTVSRDQLGEETGYFGINIHKGGYIGVSSIGCQTIPPSQWESFRSLVKNLMKEYGQKTILYHLTENTPELNNNTNSNIANDLGSFLGVPKLAWDNKIEKQVSNYLFSSVLKNIKSFYAKDATEIHKDFFNMNDQSKANIITHFFVAVAKYESEYNPKSYSVDVGTKNDKGSWSVGLYQMSANDSAAKKFKATFETLQDPIINIDVALEQMMRQIKNTGLIFLPNNSKYRYWAVLLKGNKYSKIDQIIAETRKNYGV